MRAIIKTGLAVAAGTLVVLTTAGPAGAAPAGQSSPNSATSATAAKDRPTPVTGHAAPSAKTGQTRPGGAIANHLDGFCDAFTDGTGDLCLWYYRNFQGSDIDFYTADSDLTDNTFLSLGVGQGAVAANNSESDWNFDSTYTAWVCSEINNGGFCGPIAPNTGGNFIPSYSNNVASLYWVL